MRILHVSALPVWPLAGKGGMPSLRETLRGHVRAGHKVVLALPKYNVIGEYANRITIHEDEGYEIVLAGCCWAPALAAMRRFARKLGGSKEMPYPLRWVLNLFLCFLLTLSMVSTVLRLKFIKKQKYDLVYAHNQYAALAGWITGKLFATPNVTRLYGTFLADLINKPLVWLRYPVAAAGFLIPHSLLICANDGTRGDQVAEKLRIDISKFCFWQNGVDLPAETPKSTRIDLFDRYPDLGLKVDSKWIVSCSRLSYWKRIDRMLHALKYACERGEDCQLLIAGDGPERERLSNLSTELGLADNVIWLGAVKHDQIWDLMNVADIFMITNDVTNRCNPLFEAMSAGLPVVSVKDQSTSDLLKHNENALLSDKQNLEELGEHLFLLCSDSSMLKRFCALQKQYSETFWSWQERMEEEVKELEKLVT